jgi:hypothetical protein
VPHVQTFGWNNNTRIYTAQLCPSCYEASGVEL